MNYKSGDTIAAIATPAGSGGIGIVRISGPKATQIAKKISTDKLIPRHALFTKFKNNLGITIDQGILLYFKAPNSFTGEDVIELQAHGGSALLDTLLKTCCTLGARVANPGEFSLRAFLNEKLDLAQAESLPDLIGASTEKAVIGAANSLQGNFSKKVNEIARDILELRIMVEASLDFPEEEIDFLKDLKVSSRIHDLIAQTELLKTIADEGKLLREGVTFALAGKPNVGKSSLLNALTSSNRAIVSNIPGTTRDTIEETIQLDGIPINIVDTAGLRETDDTLERQGIARTISSISQANQALLIFDITMFKKPEEVDPGVILSEFNEIPMEVKKTIIFNKSDLSDCSPGEIRKNGCSIFALSALTGEGISALKEHLKSSLSPESDAKDDSMTARQRHIFALEKCIETLKKSASLFDNIGAGELLAEDLNLCNSFLEEITGKSCSEELLTEIFSRFCIGK